jgi:aminopeptidase YwaD
VASTSLSEKAETYLRKLCVDIPSRRVGSEGNREATDFFGRVVSSFGFEIETPSFKCMDWIAESAHLSIKGITLEVYPSPYSLGCRVKAPLEVVSSMDELEKAEISDRVVLLRGDLTKEQIMPKNFPFYNPDHHKRIIQTLEKKHPLAILTATSRDLEMVGSQYPFPLFEDGDFDIPSVYLTEEEGDRLAEHVGEEVDLESVTQRIPARGWNVIARKGDSSNRRVVLFAHIDARMGSPGASDNASGVIVLLLLAELLSDFSGDLEIEVVAMNGEDYYSNPGEQQYLKLNEGRFDEILLGINVDDVGYFKGDVAYSLYDCPPDLEHSIREVFSSYEGIVEGEPWYAGDHSLFLLKKRPALALTSDLIRELMAEITHTPKDTPEILETSKLVQVAHALRDLLLTLEEHPK